MSVNEHWGQAYVARDCLRADLIFGDGAVEEFVRKAVGVEVGAALVVTPAVRRRQRAKKRVRHAAEKTLVDSYRQGAQGN